MGLQSRWFICFFFQVAPKFSTKLMCAAWFIPRHTSLEWNRFKIREMKVEGLQTEYNTISRVEFLSMLQQGILVSIFPPLSIIQHKNYFTIHLTIFQKFSIINYKRASLNIPKYVWPFLDYRKTRNSRTKNGYSRYIFVHTWILKILQIHSRKMLVNNFSRKRKK